MNAFRQALEAFAGGQLTAAEAEQALIAAVQDERTRVRADIVGDTASSSWSDPSRWVPTRAEPLGPGSTIKDRFVLEAEIGRGGMGTVFKARDLRKVEAQDDNPYVAIKILNEEFKRHPLALLCLQREARKAQLIAHPNIVTVYDFDRDGTDVYMVMELLEGESLDRVLRRLAGTGAELEEAFRITQEICQALSHAHALGIVHADFKPSNVFLTRTGAVKIFDFGIARAAKNGDAVGGDHTQFDPQTLGAHTPAYAGCEVIEGEEPDARDDLYAIACIAYELLTGRHPYKRMSGAAARMANLVATPPGRLSRRQWRALRRALSFRRADRPQSLAEFTREFARSRRSPALYVASSAAAAGVIVALFIMNAQAPDEHRSPAPAAPAGALLPVDPVGRQAEVVQSSGEQPSTDVATVAPAPQTEPRAEPVVPTVAPVSPPAEVTIPPIREQAPRVRRAEVSRPRAPGERIGPVELPANAPMTALEPSSALVRVPAIEESLPLDQKLLMQAQANQLRAAEETFRTLRARAPANDPFVIGEAPLAIAQAYMRVASAAVGDGRIETARDFAARATELVPASREFADALRRYTRYWEIGDQLNRSDSFNTLTVHHLRWRISRLAKEAPEEINAVTKRFARDFAQRIRSTSDVALAQRLSRAAQDILSEDVPAEPSPQRVVTDLAVY
jgi:hypothetical protein